MSFHSSMLVHIKEEVERLLKKSNLISEYYTDQVLLTLYPNCLYIFLFTAAPDTMKQYLIENGFRPEISNNPNNITMIYKDTVNIKVMADRLEYDVEKIRNFKIKSITLKNVIKQMTNNSLSVSEIFSRLEELAKFG